MDSRFILAISTSSGVARVAAALEPSLSDTPASKVFSFEVVDYKSQSASLLPLLNEHLRGHGLLARQCAAIAVDVGPGGFTSLRTACGVAQGLAIAWNVPAVPLSSFECMLPDSLQAEPVSVLIDARLNEIYAATLCRNEQGTLWFAKPALWAMDELQKVQGPVVCDANLFALLPSPGPNIRAGSACAKRLAELAWQEFRSGRFVEPFACQPLYVRDKVAQTTSERMALKHGAV